VTRTVDTTDADKITALATLTNHSRYAEVERMIAAFIADMKRARRASGRVARSALALAFVAPIILRKAETDGHPPTGWTKVMILNHLLAQANGTWWAPDEVVTALADARCYVRPVVST
jgi:hypothetical protein